MPVAAMTLQRKKSLPDVAQGIQLTATAPLSREEVSVLSSMRREEIRRQIDERERLRANPLLYLVSPQVKVSIFNFSLPFPFFFFRDSQNIPVCQKDTKISFLEILENKIDFISFRNILKISYLSVKYFKLTETERLTMIHESIRTLAITTINIKNMHVRLNF